MDASGNVRRFAECKLFVPCWTANLADHDRTGVNADADRELLRWIEPRVQRREPVQHLQARVHGSPRVVFVRDGVAEVDEQAVAEVLGDVALEFVNGLTGGVLISANEFDELFGIETIGERGRADEVAEHHRQLTAVGGGAGFERPAAAAAEAHAVGIV